MKSQSLTSKKIPDTPGVYFFKKKSGKKDTTLYIGRATSLRDRVRSYFGDDLIATRGPLLVDMITQATTIEWQETKSVLESIILESNLIKKFQPKYNTKEKDNRSYTYVVVTEEDFPRVMLIRGRTFEIDTKLDFKIKYKFGPYPAGGLLREALSILRRIFPFRDARSTVAHNDAFYRSLGLAPETTSPTAKKEYANTIRNIKYFFEGRTREIVNMLKQEMAVAVKNRNFEKAAVVRNTLYALEHIQDVALIKADRSDRDESISEQAEVCRIEAYDIAHMTGKNVVGVMTVVEDGELNKAEYRKFKLSSEINDDVGNLKEILTRRFAHPEWRLPDMIVVDGGVGQKHVAEKVMRIFSETSVAQNSSGQDSIKNILIVSVVKDEHHKPKDILGFEEMYKEMSASDVQKTKAAILLANAEAHRFAIAYHRLRRRKNQFGQ